MYDLDWLKEKIKNVLWHLLNVNDIHCEWYNDSL